MSCTVWRSGWPLGSCIHRKENEDATIRVPKVARGRSGLKSPSRMTKGAMVVPSCVGWVT